MKVLILQLARLGDIYLTWPVVRALRRQHPEAKIDLLVRKKFFPATEGLEEVNEVLVLDTQRLLAPLIALDPDIHQAQERVSDFLEVLRARDYDQVINLSFSPASSYITNFIADSDTQIKGYSRHSDGYLAIPDDASSYFYAQVGLGAPNRVHLGEIFSAVAEVDFIPEDWRPPQAETEILDQLRVLPKHYLVLHLGASDTRKTYGVFKWQQLIRRLAQNYEGDLVLIGADSERLLAEQVIAPLEGIKVKNAVGETRLKDLFPIIQWSQCVIGGDSVAMHMASMTNTPCVNLSFARVNFWETGPRADGSRVIWASDPEALPSDRVAEEVMALLRNQWTSYPTIVRTGGVPVGYELRGFDDKDLFRWQLVQALYMQNDFPRANDKISLLAFTQLRSVAALALEQIEALRVSSTQKMAVEILHQVDDMLIQIGRMAPEVGPLIQWFQTERLRLGPDLPEKTLTDTQELFKKLKLISSLYCPAEEHLPEPVGESYGNG